jgi:hypothetical protein
MRLRPTVIDRLAPQWERICRGDKQREEEDAAQQGEGRNKSAAGLHELLVHIAHLGCRAEGQCTPAAQDLAPCLPRFPGRLIVLKSPEISARSGPGRFWATAGARLAEATDATTAAIISARVLRPDFPRFLRGMSADLDLQHAAIAFLNM